MDDFLDNLRQHLPPNYTLTIDVMQTAVHVVMFDPAGCDVSGEDRYPGESVEVFCRRLVNDAREIEDMEPISD